MGLTADALRLATMSPTGRFVVIRTKRGLSLVDALGASPRLTLPFEDVNDFSCVGNELWVVRGAKLYRHQPNSGKELGTPLALGTSSGDDGDSGQLFAPPTEHAAMALWKPHPSSQSSSLITLSDNELLADRFEPSMDGFITTLDGNRFLYGLDKSVQVRDASGAPVTVTQLPGEGTVLAGGDVLGGRAISVLTLSDDQAALVVFRRNGALVHNVELPRGRLCAIAQRRGMAVIYTEDHTLLAVDLRFGKLIGRTDAPIEVESLAVDVNGKYIAVAGFREDDTLAVLHLTYAELFGGGASRVAQPKQAEPALDAVADDPDHDQDQDQEPVSTDTPSAEAEAPAEPIITPNVHLHALGRELHVLPVQQPTAVSPYRDAIDHLDDLLEMVAARAAWAIADAWDSGRLSMPTDDARPFESEVFALTGGRIGAAQDLLAAAQERQEELTAIVAQRQRATLAAGRRLPLLSIAEQFELSPLAMRVLSLVAAPCLRSEISRLFGILANDEARPICDRALIQLILAGNDKSMRHRIAAELETESPLIEHGLVRVTSTPSDFYLFAPLSVDPVLLARLRGDPDAGAGAGALTSLLRVHWDRIDELALPDQLRRDLVVALTREQPPEQPIRLVLRGRPGSGRRTTLSALAARAGRPLAVINGERMPRAATRFAAALRTELRRAGLRGAVPCISGIELADSSDAEGNEAIRTVLRAFPGAITFRASVEHRPPLDPGFLDFKLPQLNETERLEFWRDALARAELYTDDVTRLASRFRIGPGTIETVIANTCTRRNALPEPDENASHDLDEAARQHIENRLGSVANRIHRLATWEQVALPSDVLDSIREFLGRLSQRRRVYEDWGYDARMSSSRGLTALFHGPPGTGKSMVAGLIARELALDLYRVDLAQITSKWIGETEKNLSEVFDAAEDGQCVILFDEADSLFAKRTEVKSSVDRYANLEVNYLLQRLDTFEGIAILTTNLEGSLDSAFKRRLSLRLAFPFPDEEMRVRLWHAHIPPEVPTAGDFDFEDLAKRFPMSGGYIRNSALRAAFLAAHEGSPLSHQHIERAIQLEYREMGKLSASGRME